MILLTLPLSENFSRANQWKSDACERHVATSWVNRGENTSSILDSISVWNPIGSDVVNARLRALTFRPDFGTKREKEPKQEETAARQIRINIARTNIRTSQARAINSVASSLLLDLISSCLKHL